MEALPGATVPDLVEAQVARAPRAVAVSAGGASLTYADLDVASNRLARHLQSLGVGPETVVGVRLDRTVALAVALLGVLKAGGACLPLDPADPDGRLAVLLEDADPAVLITSTRLAHHVPTTIPVVDIEVHAPNWLELPGTATPRAVGPDHIAYVVFTSGSTGRPNAVLLTHAGLVNHHRAAVALYRLGPGDRVLQLCSLGFDASIEELFPTWAAGATVVFRPDDALLLGPEWVRWLRAQRITVMNLPTAYWHEWVHDLEAHGDRLPGDLRLVVVGGERALGPALGTWARVGGHRVRWINTYGPTEASIVATAWEDAAGTEPMPGDPPIGRPLPNVTVRVVDPAGCPVAPGATGELLIGGAGVARGYLNRPDLTAERFVIDRLGDPTSRAFRTGDLVRELPSGDLGYVGRFDDQVKIRGFRVECGEVEAALAHHPALTRAVVVARQGEGDTEKHLVAYIVPATRADLPDGELRRYLLERLPTYMVPSTFVTVDALSLTPTGKINREVLPPPQHRLDPDPASVAPRSPTEELLSAIWVRVLHLDADRFGIDDDFFALGGHSLAATQVIAQLRDELGASTPLRAIFDAPTVAGLAALVDAGAGDTGPAPPLTPRSPRAPTRIPLSLAQEQMWALEATADPPGLFNVTVVRRFERPVDESALRDALAYMVERHETLRTFVGVEEDRPFQVVAPTATIDLQVHDLSGQPTPSCAHQVQLRTAEQNAAPFDLLRSPLVRAQLFHLDGRSSRLVVTFDHLISDQTSTEVFMGELGEAYAALSSNRFPEHAPLAVQFADFALWQRERLPDERLRDQLGWWTEMLHQMPLGPAVPFDRVPHKPGRQVSVLPFCVPPTAYGFVVRLANATQSSVFIVCAAAVQSVLSCEGGTTDVVVSTTLSGRNRVELEGLIGIFAGVGRMRTDLSGDPSFGAVIARVRTNVLGVFENQDVPFLRVRDALLPDFPTDRLAVARVLPVELGYFRAPSRQPQTETFFRGQLHPLSVTLVDDGTSIEGQVRFKPDFYEATTAQRIADGVTRVLDAVATNPALRLSQLSRTGAAEDLAPG